MLLFAEVKVSEENKIIMATLWEIIPDKSEWLW